MYWQESVDNKKKNCKYTVKVYLLVFITVLIKDNIKTLFVQLN